MSSASGSTSTSLEEVKNQKILCALKGEVGEDELHERFHNYINELNEEEKKKIVLYMEKDGGELAKLYINQISLSATLY